MAHLSVTSIAGDKLVGPVYFALPPTGAELRQVVFESGSLAVGTRFKLLLGSRVLRGDEVVRGGNPSSPVTVTLVLLPPAGAPEEQPLLLSDDEENRPSVSMLDIRTGARAELPLHYYLSRDGAAHLGVRTVELAPMIGTSARALSSLASVDAVFEDEQEGPAASGRGAAATARPVIWEVVGGADAGGIIVRAGRDIASEALPTRLARGARVRELELVEERLHYEIISGCGPFTGWVSVRLAGGRVLLTPCGSDYCDVVRVRDVLGALDLAAPAWSRLCSVMEVAQQITASIDQLAMELPEGRVRGAVERARTSIGSWWSSG